MFKYKDWYKKIIGIGVNDSLAFERKLSVELVNIIIFYATPIIIVHLIYNLFTIQSVVALVISGIWLLIYSTTILLNYLQKNIVALVFFLSSCIIFSLIGMLLYGLDLRMEPFFLLYIMLVNFVFRQKFAKFATITIVLFYMIVALYVHNFGTLFATMFNFEIVGLTGIAIFIFAFLAVYFLVKKVVIENAKQHEIVKIQNNKLDFANKEMEQFTYMASHDLISPIRNVISFVDIIEKKLNDNKVEESKELLGFVKSNGKQMSLLVNDLLAFSKINRNSENEKNINLDLNVIVNNVKNILALEIKEKNALIENETLSNYYCYQSKITILLQNLILNGLKYNQSKQPTVNIFETKENGYLLLNFKDNGIGIEKQYHKQIFELFKRLHNAKEYKGTGIGLGICKKVVNDLKGKITVKSEVGKGSTFTVHLPLKQ